MKEYDIERQEYEKALKAYHNSAAYQQYLSAKNRAKVNDKSNTVGGVIAGQLILLVISFVLEVSDLQLSKKPVQNSIIWDSVHNDISLSLYENNGVVEVV